MLIQIMKIKVYYNLKGKEVDFSLGNLVIKNVDYYGYLKKEGTQQNLHYMILMVII